MDKLSVAREALEPFAKIGQYMRHTPGARSVDLFYNAVEGDGLNSRGKARLSVENFRAAREALAALAQPAPDGVRFTATVGIRRQTKSIDSLAELLRLINGGATLADIRIATPSAALTPAPQPAEFGVQRPKRLKYYPDYIDDPAGLERFREGVKTHSGHDMADVNYNSLGRLIDTIERLRFERDAAQSIAAAIRGGAE